MRSWHIEALQHEVRAVASEQIHHEVVLNKLLLTNVEKKSHIFVEFVKMDGFNMILIIFQILLQSIEETQVASI